MRRLFSTLTLAAMLGIGAVGTANAAGPGGLAPQGIASASDLVSQVGSPCGRWGCRGYGRSTWRGHSWHRDDWRRDHYRRHWRSGPSFQLYIQPRVIPRYIQPRTVYRLSSAHVAWCHARYRSYRSWDNSWQPYHGPRRSCVSPFS